jgi:hypothetical protein
MTISKTPLVYAWLGELQIDDKYNYLLRDYRWCLNSEFRLVADNRKRKDGSRKFDGFNSAVLLYQLIMYLEFGEKSEIRRHVRHLNHNVLDNRLENLAFGSSRDNQLDHEEKTGITRTHNGKWVAHAQLGGKSYCGRVKETREEAIKDYERMVTNFELHGILPKTLQERKKLPKYITLSRRSRGNVYAVQKRVDGVMAHFGYYTTLEEATKARDKFIANNRVK